MNDMSIFLPTQPDGKLRECIATEKFESTRDIGTWTGNLITVTQCVTTKPWRPLLINVQSNSKYSDGNPCPWSNSCDKEEEE